MRSIARDTDVAVPAHVVHGPAGKALVTLLETADVVGRVHVAGVPATGTSDFAATQHRRR